MVVDSAVSALWEKAIIGSRGQASTIIFFGLLLPLCSVAAMPRISGPAPALTKPSPLSGHIQKFTEEEEETVSSPNKAWERMFTPGPGLGKVAARCQQFPSMSAGRFWDGGQECKHYNFCLFLNVFFTYLYQVKQTDLPTKNAKLTAYHFIIAT